MTSRYIAKLLKYKEQMKANLNNYMEDQSTTVKKMKSIELWMKQL